jgi:hypothetical protein
MMASWKPKHVIKYYLKLQTYFINCCVETVFNKEICLENFRGKHRGANLTLLVRFQILTAVTMTTAIFWDVTPYNTVEVSEEHTVSIFRAQK